MTSVKGGPVLFKPFVGEVHYFLAELCLNIVTLPPPPINNNWSLRFDALGVEDIFKSRPQTGYWHLFGVLYKIPDEHHSAHTRLVERVSRDKPKNVCMGGYRHADGLKLPNVYSLWYGVTSHDLISQWTVIGIEL